MKKYLYNSLSILTVIGMLYSCATTKDVAPTIDENGTFGLIQSKILTPQCATAGCHASAADNSFKQHGLVLTADVAYQNLVGVACQNANAKTDGMQRVKAYKSLESLLFHKLNWENTHHNAKNYGSPMPLGGTSLYAGQIEFVRRWIEAGAPMNGSVADANLLNDRTPGITTVFKALPTPKSEGLSGFQLSIEPFTVKANFEREIFVRKELGNATDVYVSRIKLGSRPNSHHMVLYDFADKTLMPPLNTIRDLRNSDNTLNLATVFQISNHIFLGGGSDANAEYTFPEGVALLLPANTSIDLNPHYFNKTDQPITGENYVNLYTTELSKVKNVARMLNLTNTNLSIPPKQKTTITYSSKFKTDVKIFMLTSHTHRLGERFVIKIVGGARDGEVVYENTDWEHPLVKTFAKPLELKKDEGLMSIVTYNNTTDKAVKFGFTSDDEMDIIFGYFYE